MEFQTIIKNYNAKSSIEPEIFGIFQHKVERTSHFARVSEVRHISFSFQVKHTREMMLRVEGSSLERSGEMTYGAKS